jgi:hypothetical protein
VVPPDLIGFYRPCPMDRTAPKLDPLTGRYTFVPTDFFPRPDMSLEPLAVFEWDDPIRGQTIPNLYGGSLPIHGRDHPRLRVAVYRVVRAWRAE